MIKSLTTVITLGLGLILLSGCATIPVEQQDSVRAQINRDAESAIARMTATDPELAKKIDAAEGYFVSLVSATKVPLLGIGSGLGVLFDGQDDSLTYMNISRTDIGLGLGSGAFQVLILFETRDRLEEFRGGLKKVAVGTEFTEGNKITNITSASREGYSVHVLTDSGAGVVASTRLVSFSINNDLTDSGVSDIGIPNTQLDGSNYDYNGAPRIWNYRLPFLAQRVIDEGYDLPLPYGIGVVYADVTQEMLLTDLEVGINGRDQEPFNFVSFDNAEATNDSLQLKLDAWLFPFMNVFALLGRVDGEAPLDVILDGNESLDYLGIDCSAPGPPNPLCGRLQDQEVTLPITAPFSGNTYGLGVTLAGGWNNWFVAIPMAYNYADMDGTNTDGIAVSASPRFGRVLNLETGGNLSLYLGGNYLDTDLTVSGTVSTPEDQLVIDYTVQQKNKDPWNAVVGFNWDFSKNLSWTAEYNGFVGSRESYITSLVWRL